MSVRFKYQSLFSIFFLFATLSSPTAAAPSYYDQFTIPEAIGDWETGVEIKMPSTLFHWTSLDSLQKWSESSGNGEITLKTMHNEFPVTNHIPQLQYSANRGAIYAWSNPVGSLTNDAGNERVLKDLGLVRFKMNSKAKAVRIDAQVGPSGFLPLRRHRIKDIDSIDALLVTYKRGDTVVLSEWLILNPAAINEFTANPKDLKADLQPYLDKFERGEGLTARELYHRLAIDTAKDHWINRNLSEVKGILNEVLKKGRPIPSLFLPTDCVDLERKTVRRSFFKGRSRKA